MATIAKINGVTWASVAKVNGIAVASIAKINGVDKPATSTLDPLTLSPWVWFDASDATTLFTETTAGDAVGSNGYVRRWEDKSDNNYHATIQTDALRPQRVVSQQNSKDVLRFAGAQMIQTGSITPGGSYTICVAFKNTSVVDSFLLELGMPAWQTNGFNVQTYPLMSFFQGATSGSAYSNIKEETITTTTWHSWICTRDKSKTSAETMIYRDGSECGHDRDLDSDLTNDVDAGQLRIGQRDSGLLPFSGDIGEILIFSKLLSVGETADVVAYFKNKWGTP